VLYPVNRYILIDIPTESGENESAIVLPDDYKPAESRFVEVVALGAAWDVRFEVEEDARLVVDRSMIEEISIGDTIYNVILDNYVVGMIE
jgi:co-chaperonin GroES (HSP10)